jgi:hypothetical protein
LTLEPPPTAEHLGVNILGEKVWTRALKKLEELGILSLPLKDGSKKRVTQKKIWWTSQTDPQAIIDCNLSQIAPIRNVHEITSGIYEAAGLTL